MLTKTAQRIPCLQAKAANECGITDSIQSGQELSRKWSQAKDSLDCLEIPTETIIWFRGHKVAN